MSRVAALLVASVAAAAIAACNHNAIPPGAPITAVSPPTTPLSPSDKLVALLPDGAQVIVELDLARLRANAVVGETARRVLADMAVSTDVELPMKVPVSPLAETSTVVLAAYGVGTADAATITLLATPAEVPGGRKISDGVVGLGPEVWLDQVAERADLATRAYIAPSADMVQLRDHAMPAGATGAVARLTARLSFDARVSLARQTGIELAPAQMSVWVDVADDLAIVIDADAGKEATPKMAAMVRALLGELASAPAARALGLPNNLLDARQERSGSWVRTVLAIGPNQLKRVVARANALLGPVVPPPGAGSGAGSGADGSAS